MFTDILRRKNFFNDKKNKKKQNAHLSVSGTVPKTQCLLAEQQAHEQVEKVQIKPSFIAKLLTCVSGHSIFFRKCG